jgi:hypothetical protein
MMFADNFLESVSEGVTEVVVGRQNFARSVELNYCLRPLDCRQNFSGVTSKETHAILPIGANQLRPRLQSQRNANVQALQILGVISLK